MRDAPGRQVPLILSMLSLVLFFAHPEKAEAVILYLTFQKGGTFAGTSFQRNDIVRYDVDSGISSLFFDGGAHFIGGKEKRQAIDGIEVLPDGTFYLSTHGAATLPGLSFQRNDVVHYDPVNHVATLVIDGATYFKNPNTQLDVIDSLPDGTFLLSSTGKATFAGLPVGGDDIFKFDPISGTASLFFDGGSLFKKPVDLDAFDILSDGRYLFSISEENRKTLDGLTINDADIGLYEPSTGHVCLFLDHTTIPDWTGSTDIRGISSDPITPEPMSASLFGFGLLGLFARRRRRR